MYSFGTASNERVKTCHPDIRRVLTRAIGTSPVDFAVVCGQRNEADQEAAFDAGKSKARYGQSKHNYSPFSLAVDVAPYISGRGLVWDDETLWFKLAGHIITVAETMGVRLRWGGNFSGAWDKPHFELDWALRHG